MQKHALLTAALLLASTSIVQAEPLALDLPGVLKAALENSPHLKSSEEELQQSEGQIGVAAAGFKPRVELSQEYGRRRARAGAQSWEYMNASMRELSIEQPLFNGGANWAEWKQSKALYASSQMRHAATKQQLLFDTINAYVRLKLTRDILELNQFNISALEKQYNATSERFAVQDVTQADLSQAQSRLSAAQSFYVLAEAEAKQAESNFVRLTGLPAPAALPSAERILPLPESLDQALQIAEANNPELQRSHHEKVAADYAEDAAFGAMLPRVSLVASTSTSRGQDTLGTLGRVDDDSIKVDIRIPLYQAGAAAARLKIAKHAFQKAKFDEMDAEQGLQESVRNIWALYKASEQATVTNLDAVDSALKTLQSLQEEYNHGQRTLTDLLDAEREFFDNQITWARAEADTSLYAYRLHAMMGTLSIPQ